MLSKYNSKISTCLWVLFCSFFSALAFSAEPINTLEKKGFFSYDPSGTAIRGADTVAYFTESKYIPGKDEFTTQWQGATWKFSSQQHLDLFTENPEKFAPQYGGYCAYGVAGGYLVKIEPENWSIVDNKLYLNYSDGVQKKWEKNIAGFIQEANQNFAGLLKQ
jgi:YHS domain-containing protein